MLDQDPGEALERSEQRTVDHDRPVLGVVGPEVHQAEAFRHLVVQLDRPHLPGAAERVRHVQVDLRPVERALAGADRVLHPVALQRLLERRLGAVPLLVGAEACFGTRRELGLRVSARRGRRGTAAYSTIPCDLVLDLLLRDEDVRVVLRDVLDAQQPVQRPAALVAVERSRTRHSAAAARGSSAARSPNRSMCPGQFIGLIAPGASRPRAWTKNMFSW